MDNSVYDKAMENLRKWVKFRLVDNAKNYRNWVSRSNYVSQRLFSRNVITNYKVNTVLTLDKSIYAVFSSLNYEIEIYDVDEDFHEDMCLFNFSSYHKDLRLLWCQ